MKMWINCISSNPREYGKKTSEYAMVYSSPDVWPDNFIGIGIPHGEEVEVLEIIRECEVCRIKYKDVEGYIQFTRLADDNPAKGHQFNPFH